MDGRIANAHINKTFLDNFFVIRKCYSKMKVNFFST